MSKSISMKYKDWPSIDRNLYQKCIQQHDTSFLAVAGPSSWAQSSKNLVVFSYGRWLRYCEQTGVDLDHTAPTERVTKERMTAFLTLERNRLAMTTLTTALSRIMSFLIAIDPAYDWTWLRSVSRYLKKIGRCMPVKHPKFVHAADIFLFARHLMDQCLSEDGGQIQDARAYRDGLIIAMMIVAPARIGNISDIKINTNIINDGRGWYLRFSACETKEDKDDEWPLSPALIPYLEIYIEHVRPALMRPDLRGEIGCALWI
ncbi:hypothetical protein WCLP8_3380001 [uncultured Gammaproteobacteria bacterium]